MKKKIISSIIILFTSIIININSFATSDTIIKISSDKTTASAGDIINYTITANATGEVTVLDFYLDIPDGLTYIKDSGKIGKDLKSIEEKSFTENDLGQLCTFANSEPFSLNNVQLVTFQCKVNEDSSENYTVDVKDLEIADEDFSEISSDDIKKELTKIEITKESTEKSSNKERKNSITTKNKAETETKSEENFEEKSEAEDEEEVETEITSETKNQDNQNNKSEMSTKSSKKNTTYKKNPVVEIGDTIDVNSIFNLGDDQEILENSKITSSNNDIITVNEERNNCSKR